VVVREEQGEPWIWMAVAAADQRAGRIVRMRPDGRDREVVFASTGRPLGFDFDSAGALIVADPRFGAHGGLLRVTGRGADASTELLTDRVGDTPLRYVDAVVVATDGRIYLSDASQRFGAREFGGTFEASVLDIIEHQCSGRILQYDPATRATVVVLRDLCFPNGVALSDDQQRLFVAETGAYRIWRVRVDARELSAAHAAHTPDPRAAIVLDNLPGYPDNLMRGTNGRIWTGLTKPRSGFIDTNASRPGCVRWPCGCRHFCGPCHPPTATSLPSPKTDMSWRICRIRAVRTRKQQRSPSSVTAGSFRVCTRPRWA
jgi:sugar lactone lactonase YvrE